MPDQRITELTPITGAQLDNNDPFVVVDRSDPTMAPTGTNKQLSVTELGEKLLLNRFIKGDGLVNEIAFFEANGEIGGSFELTWNGSTLNLQGDMDITGQYLVNGVPLDPSPTGTPNTLAYFNATGDLDSAPTIQYTGGALIIDAFTDIAAGNNLVLSGGDLDMTLGNINVAGDINVSGGSRKITGVSLIGNRDATGRTNSIIFGQNTLPTGDSKFVQSVAVGNNIAENIGANNSFNNVLIGFANTQQTGGNPITSINSSVIIGANSAPGGVNYVNEIVIGSFVTGNGSNTVTIGRATTTDNYFSGNIDITGQYLINWVSCFTDYRNTFHLSSI